MDEVCGLTTSTSKQNIDNDDYDSPFIAYQDGYEYPTLYTELVEMIETSIIIYPLAELRAMARSKRINDDGILEMPLTHAKAMQYITKHKALLVDDDNTKFLHKEFYREIFETAHERQMDQLLEVTTSSEEKKDEAVAAVAPVQIVAVDDEFEKQELVYSIQVHETRQRITVCFRGSVTKTDWATNYEIHMKDVANPVKGRESQPEFVKVHHGFYNYLFEPSSRGATGPNGEELSEYQEIMQEHVLPVIRQYPGYKVRGMSGWFVRNASLCSKSATHIFNNFFFFFPLRIYSSTSRDTVSAPLWQLYLLFQQPPNPTR